MGERVRGFRRRAVPPLGLGLGLLLFAWLLGGSAGAEPVVVGSKAFTESRVLAEIMVQLIEARTDLEVEHREGLGGTKIVFSALESGAIDLYPEYTGTGYTVMLGRSEPGSSLRTYLEVRRAFEERHRATWLSPFGFSNSYALAMHEDKARALGVTRISDLLPHQRQLRAGLSHEFLERGDGFPRLAAAYGLDLAEVRGMEHGLAYKGIQTGTIDLVDAYTTDGKLLDYDVRVLEDDRDVFPPYDAAPIARMDVLERHPSLRPVLEELAFRIDEATMRKLNHDAEARGGAFAAVAHDWLVAERLLAPSEAPIAPERSGSFLGYLWQNRRTVLSRVLEHLTLTGLGVLLATLLGLPLGVALTRYRRAAPAVLGAAGVIQTIPGLALLAFMIPIPGLGLGTRSAVVALFLYALLPIVRNAYTGIREVDPELVEAAHAMGLTPRQVLFRVELPLAARTVMAGIRTATVITVGVATLAAFIGAGGLGEAIVTGLSLDDVYLVLSGAAPAAALAIIVDGALGRLERWLVPAFAR